MGEKQVQLTDEEKRKLIQILQKDKDKTAWEMAQNRLMDYYKPLWQDQALYSYLRRNAKTEIDWTQITMEDVPSFIYEALRTVNVENYIAPERDKRVEDSPYTIFDLYLFGIVGKLMAKYTESTRAITYKDENNTKGGGGAKAVSGYLVSDIKLAHSLMREIEDDGIKTETEIYDELAELLNKHPDRKAQAPYSGSDVYLMYREYRTIFEQTISLDEKVKEEEGGDNLKKSDTIAYKNSPFQAPEDVINSSGNTLLLEAISDLSERDQQILKARFGLEDGRPRSLEEVGQMFNVTKERIRQIEVQSLRRLRQPSRSPKLKKYLE